MKQYSAILLGRDKYFRAEISFEIDEATPGDPDDLAEEQADHYAVGLMTQGTGRLDIDSVYEIVGRP